MPAEQPTATYTGTCHCTRVRFSISIPPLYPPDSRPVIKCNCALCTKHGLLMTHCPRASLVFTRGFNDLSDYSTGGKTRVFRFCKWCGTPMVFDVEEPEGNGEEFVGVNVRTIADIDIERLEITNFDGKAQGGPYVVPPSP